MVGMGLGTSTGTLARVVGGLGRASERKARVGFERHQPGFERHQRRRAARGVK